MWKWYILVLLTELEFTSTWSQFEKNRIKTRQANTSCKLPAPPEHGGYSSYHCRDGEDCLGAAGSSVQQGVALTYHCETGFTLRGQTNVVCVSGKWTPSDLPVCSGGCPPLKSNKMDINCVLGRSQVRCDSDVPKGTDAFFSCRSPAYKPYKSFLYKKITCRASGEWSRHLPEDSCIIDCGKALNTGVEAYVNKGKNITHGEFPWHVGLYEKVVAGTTRVWVNQCGGTIITSTVVITAAHCVAELDDAINLQVKDPSRLSVGVGKFYREIDEEMDKNAVLHKVRTVATHIWYKSYTVNYLYDIAFLFLVERIEFWQFAAPVCLDVSPSPYELRDREVGQVVGWGRNKEGLLSPHLVLAELPYVPMDVCTKRADTYIRASISQDKMCAGDLNSSVAVCKGDSGGGLVFYHPVKEAYYLHGIVSLGKKGCAGETYTLFTNISVYVKDVAAVVNSDPDEDPLPVDWTLTRSSKQDSTTTTVEEEPCWPLTSQKLLINCSKDDSPVSCEEDVQSGTTADLRCKGDSRPSYNHVTCRDGAWSRPLPHDSCPSEPCSPLTSQKLLINCSKDDSPVSCEEDVPSGTTADLRCNGDSRPSYNHVTCRDGAWSRPLPHDSCPSGHKGNPLTGCELSASTLEVQLSPGTSLYKAQEAKDVPPNAISTGLTLFGHVYVGYVQHDKESFAAKIIPQKNDMFYPYGGKEYITNENITFLVVQPGYTYEWVASSHGNIVPNAVALGKSSSGNPYYVCRVTIDDERCVGKIYPSHGVCYVSWGFKEHQKAFYDILVVKKNN